MTPELNFELYGVWKSHQSTSFGEIYHHKPDCIVLIRNTGEVIEYRPSKQKLLMKPGAVPLTDQVILLTRPSAPDEIPF